ncbi:MAG: TrkH family potassium uptake protein [Clostridiaceae bacterium]|nr:TrkH family potassium uptake protein [Clostridiaceae bacterium]
MNYRMVWFLLRWIMRLEAVFMVPAMLISLQQGETASARALAGTIVLLMVCSFLYNRKPSRREFFAREGFVSVGLTWIVVSLFGALPFTLSGAIPSYVDAFFETVSGFTTTGASILTNVEGLSMGLLYWRSFTHFLGGMGVLVFVLAIIPLADSSGGNSLYLLRAESTGPQVSKLVPKMRDTAVLLYGIYVLLTVLQVVLLLLGGMPLFDAVTTAFGTAGTGGFGIKNDSMASYSTYIQVVTGIFMMLFGVNFNIYFLVILRSWRKALKSEELRTYLGIMGTSILLITGNLMVRQGHHFFQALHLAGFQVSSVMTTTGFATADFNLWPQLSKSILLTLMILGACAGSTGGGIKTARLLILIKSARNSARKLMRPRQVTGIRLDGQPVDGETVAGVYGYMVVYVLISIGSMLLISFDNMDMETTISSVVATLNNIGPGFGAVGASGNYSGYSDFSKLVLSMDMLVGRLEIFPVLLMFFPSVWHRGRERK